MSKFITRCFAAVCVLACLGCGGSQDKSGDTVGQSTAGGGPASDLDLPAGDGAAEPGAPDAGAAEVEAAPYTFVLKNTDVEPLVFNMDAGWAANIIVFSGKPPKAKVILPFAKHCTAACDVDPEQRCPDCPEPEKLKDIRAAQKLEQVESGQTLEVPWDGMVHAYSKTKGKLNNRARTCECYQPEPAPEDTYTVRACGLRLTTTAEVSTKIQCIDTQLVIPGEAPQRLEIEFPAPPVAKKKKK